MALCIGSGNPAPHPAPPPLPHPTTPPPLPRPHYPTPLPLGIMKPDPQVMTQMALCIGSGNPAPHPAPTTPPPLPHPHYPAPTIHPHYPTPLPLGIMKPDPQLMTQMALCIGSGNPAPHPAPHPLSTPTTPPPLPHPSPTRHHETRPAVDDSDGALHRLR